MDQVAYGKGPDTKLDETLKKLETQSIPLKFWPFVL